MKSACIAILNYNGADLLEAYLPSVISVARESRHRCRVLVLDNCSVDRSEELVRKHFPEVEWKAARENRVLCSYNDLARELTEDVLILLNNDIRPYPGFVDPLLDPFEKDGDDLFLVATQGDAALPSFHWGVLTARLDDAGCAARSERLGPAFSAGIGAFDRKKFLELGGYDDLYLPGRYEDVDLCYRGWKRGWRALHQPASRKDHVGGVSFNKAFSSNRTEAMVFRNGILFMVKNIRDWGLLARCAFLAVVRLAAAALRGRWHYFAGFKEALDRMPAALRRRAEVRGQFRISDREALRRAGAWS